MALAKVAARDKLAVAIIALTLFRQKTFHGNFGIMVCGCYAAGSLRVKKSGDLIQMAHGGNLAVNPIDRAVIFHDNDDGILGSGTFEIGGVSCAVCTGHVEKALRSVPHIHQAIVNLSTSRAKSQYKQTPTRTIIHRTQRQY